ncbi:MAG: YheC/YheD family protein [Firmicutes bacterium]|nr:YheC/YheD family protein [Bacillota bacterium]
MASRRPELGKWLLWKWFYNDPAFRTYLPHTVRYTDEKLVSLLHQHQSVYVKPVAGARGKNIVKVNTLGDHFFVHAENKLPIRLDSQSALLRYLAKHRGRAAYIVQQDIRLAKINDRPFDIRVMMQKNAQGQWLCTGLCAKVAGPHSAVTNVARSRGHVVTVEKALKDSLRWSTGKIATTEKQLRELGFATCKRLEMYQPYTEIGVDVGIDAHGKIWMLEQNTGPSHSLFRHLSDPSVYQLIQQTRRERIAARSARRAVGK